VAFPAILRARRLYYLGARPAVPGGYNPVDGEQNVVWCLNAGDGLWSGSRSPCWAAIHV